MELRTMLSSHMQRQLKLDELLKQEPRLMPPSANVSSFTRFDANNIYFRIITISRIIIYLRSYIIYLVDGLPLFQL